MVTTGTGPLLRSVRYELWVIVMLPDHMPEKIVLVFAGALCCIVNDFLIQNVIYDISIFSSEDDDPSHYDEAIARLNKSYPWPPEESKKIAEIRPSVGADITIEFSTV
jgi:hypothetical protein